MADAEGEVFEFSVFPTLSGLLRLPPVRLLQDAHRGRRHGVPAGGDGRNGGWRARWSPTTCPPSSSSASGRRVSARFARFAAAGFELGAGAARSTDQKGKVESSNRFLSSWPSTRATSAARRARGRHRAHRGLRCNTEPSASTGVPPAVPVHAREGAARVGNMGLLESMVADVSVQAVPPRCSSAAGAASSVPRRCIGRRVKVLAMPSGQVVRWPARPSRCDLSAPGGPSSTTRRTTPRPWPRRRATPMPTSRRRPAPTWSCSAGSGRGRCERQGTRAAPAPAYARTSRAEAGRHGGGAAPLDVGGGRRRGRLRLGDAHAMTSEEAEASTAAQDDRKVRAAGFPFVKTLADFRLLLQPSIPRAVVDDLATPGSGRGRERGLVDSPAWARPTSRWRWGGGGARPQGGALHRLRGAGARPERTPRAASWRSSSVLRPRLAAHHRRAGVPGRGRGGGRPAVPARLGRYEHHSTVTTNVAVGLWADVFGDAVTAAAIADRCATTARCSR